MSALQRIPCHSPEDVLAMAAMGPGTKFVLNNYTLMPETMLHSSQIRSDVRQVRNWPGQTEEFTAVLVDLSKYAASGIIVARSFGKFTDIKDAFKVFDTRYPHLIGSNVACLVKCRLVTPNSNDVTLGYEVASQLKCYFGPNPGAIGENHENNDR